jgi:lysophospholipase L1-like esterase
MHSQIPPRSIKKLRDSLLVPGGGILCVVLAISVMRLAGVVTSIHISLWILGGATVSLGGLLLLSVIDNVQVRRFLADSYRAIAILTLNALVLCVVLELAARTIFKLERVISQPAEQLVGEGSPRETVSYYSSQDWAKRYWHEFRLSKKERYYPYVGWRRAAFKGETVNIDPNGIRVTPGADCSAKSFKVFAFGESSMWGTGSPDWGTIPANLQKGLEKTRPGPVCVINFGESAYNSAQDVIMLLLQLRSGNVPDLVLFYSIAGDIGVAYESGRADVHANLDVVAARFEGSKPPTIVDWLRSSSAYALIDALVGKLTIANPQQQEAGQGGFLDRVTPTPSGLGTYETSGIDVAKLSESIVENYFRSYEIVKALGQQFGFKYSFIVPPIISRGNKPLTREEEEMKHRLVSNAALDKLVTAVYQKIERESGKYQNLYSMVHIFDRQDELIWIDEGHVTPMGNQLIARRMLEVVQGRSSHHS